MRRMTNFWAFIKKLASLIGFTGNKIEVGNDLEVDGKLKAFENITDAKDNSRFVEGALTTIGKEGITYNYNKWSLSGSHLMIVMTFSATQGTSISSGSALANFALPKWILDKIIPIYNVYVSRISVIGIGSGADVSYDFSLTKSQTACSIVSSNSVTFTRNENIRVQFDLLIDNAN